MQSISLICCICTYFCIICFSQISRFLCRISAKAFSGSKTNKFYDEVIFFRKTCLLDNLKELLLIRNIMTFADTQQHFVDTQQHFVVTHFFAHLD
jgi:hypothetical protein